MEEQPQPNNEQKPEEPTDPLTEKKALIEGETLSRAAWKAYKAEFSASFVPTFIFAMLFICLLAVGLWQPWTLYVTLPFLGLPLFFALQITLSDARQGRVFTNKGFFSFFAMYFKMPYFDVYRVLGNVLWAFVFSLLVSFLFNGVYAGVAYTVDPLFATGFDGIMTAYQNTDLDGINSIIDSNSSINLYFFVSLVVENGTWFLISLYKISVWCLNPYIRSAMKRVSPNPQIANSLFKGGYRSALPNIRKEYFKALWLGLLLLVVGFASGAAVGCLWTEMSDRIIASGVIGSFVFIVFYLPYFLIVMEMLASHYDGVFAKYSVAFAEKTLHQLEETKRLSEEEAKEIQKMIDDAKNRKPSDDDADGDDDDDDYE